MQIGWADHTFVPGGPDSGDGIGDLEGSWAYDGVRQQRWNEEQSDYGEAWKVRWNRGLKEAFGWLGGRGRQRRGEGGSVHFI